MKKNIWFIFISLFLSCVNKERVIENEVSVDNLVHTSDLYEDRKGQVIQIIEPYVDSLNSHIEGNLPYFLFDSNIDLINEEVYNLYQKEQLFYSIKVEIFKRVNNLKVLNKIAKETSLTEVKYFEEPYTLPSDKFSISTLAKFRLKELNTGDDILLQLGLTPSTLSKEIQYEIILLERDVVTGKFNNPQLPHEKNNK